MRPLLTIGIPTYNRAELLRLGLRNLFAIRRGFEAEVEVVVSDNASWDDTQAMLAEFAVLVAAAKCCNPLSGSFRRL